MMFLTGSYFCHFTGRPVYTDRHVGPSGRVLGPSGRAITSSMAKAGLMKILLSYVTQMTIHNNFLL